MESSYRDAKFAELKASIREAGLMRRRYGAYIVLASCIVLTGGLSLYFVTVTDSLILQVLNAILFTIATVQAGMLGHDLSHGQVFASQRMNRTFGALVWGLAGGLSENAWYEQHNTHHEHVNQDGHDPDINIPFLFSSVQHMGSYRLPSRLIRHQHILFFVSLPVWYLSKLTQTWRRTFEFITTKRGAFEFILAVVHFAVLGYFLILHLPLVVAGVFMATHIAASGLYMGIAFAPNHKGEEIIPADGAITWQNQITSTRNLYPTMFAFHVFGGLNLQIEHHLFPGMPRYNYPLVQPMVKKFCLEHGLRYHETSWAGSMKEIYVALKAEALASRA